MLATFPSVVFCICFSVRILEMHSTLTTAGRPRRSQMKRLTGMLVSLCLFLADCWGWALGTMCRLSVCNACTVAKGYVLP